MISCVAAAVRTVLSLYGVWYRVHAAVTGSADEPAGLRVHMINLTAFALLLRAPASFVPVLPALEHKFKLKLMVTASRQESSAARFRRQPSATRALGENSGLLGLRRPSDAVLKTEMEV